MSEPVPLTSFSAISFDCYGTLVDWESGIIDGLRPLTDRLCGEDAAKCQRNDLLHKYINHEGAIQRNDPQLKYTAVLERVYEALATELGLEDTITEQEKVAFGASIGTWPALPDTIAALKVLGQYYKLIILSNVDTASFKQTLAGPLAEITFDAVYVAEDIGTYKPDPNNFKYLVEHCEQDFRIPKEKLLHTAYALVHDLIPAYKFGLSTCWIERKPNAVGGDLEQLKGQLELDHRYAELQDMADAAEKAFSTSR